MDFRQRLFQYRSYMPIPFLIVMVAAAYPTIASLVVGFCFVVLGESIRLWGVAIAGSETRTTGPVGGTFLVTTGPFSYIRNPLYLGNILIYLGIGIAANVWWLAIGAFVFFFWQYSVLASLEEEYLLKSFGEEYVQYCEFVPRFVPRLTKYDGGSTLQPPIDWKRGLASEKRTLQAIMLMTILSLVLWQIRMER